MTDLDKAGLRRLLTVGLLLAVLPSIPTARADATVYTDQASFLATLSPGYYQESFDSLTLGGVVSPLPFSQGGLSYSVATANGTDFFNVGPADDVWLSTANSEINIVFDLAGSPTPINAVGGYFFLTDLAGDVVPGATTLRLNDGTSFTLSDAGATTFLGFISSDPLSSLTFDQPDGTVFAAVNDFIVGQAVAVPEPATYALLATGGDLGTYAS